MGPRLDAAVSREYYAQLKEAQGHFIGARKFRKGGQDRGEMACGNNNVQARCSQTMSYKDVGPAGVRFTAQRHAREQTGPPDTGPCVRNMEQLQKLHWRLDDRRCCSH
ncbi:hypothetical protein WJX82_007611 [Trebouxia sp. C0006]